MDVICFHNPNKENGYLSNWYMSNFVWEGITFSSMEQYMMYRKAILFKDIQIANRILSLTDVAKIKSLGRRVSNFNEDIWNKHKQAIITEGLICKFQDEELRNKLLTTGTLLLAECAIKDTIWGIGLSMHDKRRFNPSEWRGQNLLGKCLMKAREYYANKLMEEGH